MQMLLYGCKLNSNYQYGDFIWQFSCCFIFLIQVFSYLTVISIISTTSIQTFIFDLITVGFSSVFSVVSNVCECNDMICGCFKLCCYNCFNDVGCHTYTLRAIWSQLFLLV